MGKDRSLYSQSYGFSSSHVQMWELDHKEGWVLKNWCLWTVVLEKTLESPLRRSNQSNLKEINPEYSLDGLMLRLKLQYFGHNAESQLTGKDPGGGKDWGLDEKGMTEDEIVGWHHWLDGHELSKLQEILKDRKALHGAVHGVTKSWTHLSDWAELILSSNDFQEKSLQQVSQ